MTHELIEKGRRLEYVLLIIGCLLVILSVIRNLPALIMLGWSLLGIMLALIVNRQIYLWIAFNKGK